MEDATTPPPPPPSPAAPPPPAVRKAPVAEETFDSPKQFASKLKKLHRLVKDAKGSVVVYTGAGISTAAKIPDYRSSDGLYAHGILRPQSTDLHSIYPTRSHMAITELYNRGHISFVVTSNHDNLHKRSGVPDEAIAELFGNGYEEFCLKCGKYYHRPRPVPRIGAHITGRMCEAGGCDGRLKNFSVDFGQSIPEEPIKKAMKATKPFAKPAAKLALVLGSSLTVRPFSTFPPQCQKMVIVSIQETPLDKQAALKINAKIDDVMIALMDAMGLQIPRFVLQEDYFIEEQHKEEDGKVRLVVRGDRFVSCDDFIDRISIADTSRPNETFEMTKQEADAAGHFWYAFDANYLPKSVAMSITFRDRFHRPREEFIYEFAANKEDACTRREFTFDVDFDNPPDVATISTGGGALLEAIAQFPGREFLQKGGGESEN